MIFGRESAPEPTEQPTPEPTEEPTPEPTPEPTAEPTPEPTEEPSATTESALPLIGVQYRCVEVEIGGHAIDIAALGGPYAVIFYENGTADLTLAGTTLYGSRWEQTADDAFTVTYLNDQTMTFTVDGRGLRGDYLDAIQLWYEVE